MNCTTHTMFWYSFGNTYALKALTLEVSLAAVMSVVFQFIALCVGQCSIPELHLSPLVSFISDGFVP